VKNTGIALLSALSATLLAACATGGSPYSQPYALFEADPRNEAADTRPAIPMKIDGSMVRIGERYPVAPGVRQVEVSIPGPRGMSDPGRQTLSIDAKACTRYYLTAKRSTRTSDDWRAMVEYTEVIGECASKFGGAK
jgi:hypothetical protein